MNTLQETESINYINFEKISKEIEEQKKHLKNINGPQ